MKKVQINELSVKVIVSLGLIVFTIIGIYSIIFSLHYKKYEDRQLGQENLRTLHSMETSIDNILDNADEYSKMIVADNVIQSQMDSGDLFENLTEQSEVIKKIYSIFQFSDSIDAIWLIDNNGQKLSVGGSANITFSNENQQYSGLQKPYGEYRIFFLEDGKKEKLSLVRSYNDLESFESKGIIGVDIDCSIFDELIKGVINTQEEEFLILNEYNEVVYSAGCLSDVELLADIIQAFEDNPKEVLEQVEINSLKYMMAGVNNEETDWKVVRYTPMRLGQSKSEIVSFNITLIGVIGILILLCAAVLSRMLTRPIHELLVCMKGTENGEFLKTKEVPILDEFKLLFHGYNRMVDQIETLIQNIIDKQRRIRRAELNEIQEQMKPHFLYNTLDSIQALAMMGETDKVCKLVEILGDFYRKSVSGGRELLTIEEEFKIAQDYADIMKIRFENSFDFQAELAEDCKDFLIPKLTIQPLVENSFQHGIRAREKFGEIHLRAFLKNDRLHIEVKDNGEGISQNVINELSIDAEPHKGKSLGLRGTIERLRLLYGEYFSFRINSHGVSEVHLLMDVRGLRGKEDGEPKDNYC